MFLDIGGVLLTDGWQTASRKLAAKAFRLDFKRNGGATSDGFRHLRGGKADTGRISDRVVFHQKRPFTQTQFRKFMFAQSKPYPEMIELVRQLKASTD